MTDTDTTDVPALVAKLTKLEGQAESVKAQLRTDLVAVSQETGYDFAVGGVLAGALPGPAHGEPERHLDTTTARRDGPPPVGELSQRPCAHR